MLLYVKNLYTNFVRDDVLMKGKSIITVALMLALSGCGGSGEDVSKNEQPWFGGQLPEPTDDGSGDVENTAPQISADFYVLSEVSFGQEVSISVFVEDAEGDEVDVSLYNAPEWLSWHPELSVIKGTVNEIGDYSSFQIGAVDSADNESEIISSPKFSVPMPSQFPLEVKLPVNISAGDSVNLYFIDTSEDEKDLINFGASVDEYGVAKFEGFTPNFEEYESRTLVVEWQSQSYAPLFNIVGPASIIESELNSSLELSAEAFSKMAPTVQSAAYYHLLQKYSSRPGNASVVGFEKANNYHGAFAGDVYKDMIGYYSVAQKYGELYGINNVLLIDLFTGHELEFNGQKAGLPLIHEPVKDPALYREITRERLNYDSSVSGRLWEDLLNKESQSAINEGSGFSVTPGDWSLTFANSSLYGDSKGYIVTLNDDNVSSMMVNGRAAQGEWSSSSNAGEYALEVSFKGLEPEIFNYTIEQMPSALSALGMNSFDVNEYLEMALANGKSSVDISLVKNTKLNFTSHYSPFENVSIGDLTTESVVSLLGNSSVLTETHGAQLSMSAKKDLDSWYFDSSIYEVILKLPGEDKYRWLDLYYGENVVFKKGEGSAVGENWSWSYDSDDKVLTLLSSENGVETVSKYIIEREPSMHIFNSGDINSRVYGVRNIVEEDGDVVIDELSSLILHPTARCEYYVDDLPPCSFETVQPAKVSSDNDEVKDSDFKFWFDTSLGSLKLGNEYEGQSLLYIGDVASGSDDIEDKDFRMFTLESGGVCENSSEEGLCFASSSDVRATDNDDKNAWFVGEGVWHPIYVTANEMIVVTGDGEIRTYIAFDPLKVFGDVTVKLSWE